ncbi:MAG: cation:proton antiporter [Methanomassiliicoccales archaeon]|nr:cation:proton antiporter [Methanomassiliicoccales archaeon]
MITTESVMLEVGAVMLIAFVGAAIASKLRQSVILGYILAGVLIGPNIHLQLGSITYNGIVTDTTLIDYFSYLGLILLMFFIGLEFSISKIKKTKSTAAILAMVNLGVNMFTGIMLGTALGWPLIDTVFLAGIISMSSSAVAMKSVIELKRLANPETEFLIGVSITESFLSMLLLTIIGGLMVKDGSGPVDLTALAIGIGVFYAFFVVLAIWIIPRTVKHLQRIKSDEMFVIFALGIVFLSAALAEISGVPAIIGAFFIGMVFAETKVSSRFEEKIVPFRDAFVAIFFVSFGMLIDPAMFLGTWWIVAIAVGIVILNDLFITAILAYFLGFSARASVTIGSSLCGRDAESVMFASVGSRAVGATKGAELYPFAGVLCFITSAIAPPLMRRSVPLAEWLSRRLPEYIKFSSAIISRTLGKIMMPSAFPLHRKTRRMGIALIIYFIVLAAVVVTVGPLHIVAFCAALAFAVVLGKVFPSELQPIVRSTSYTNIGFAPRHPTRIVGFVSSIIMMSLLMIVIVAFLFIYFWPSVLLVLLAYFLGVILLMKLNYERTYDFDRIRGGPPEGSFEVQPRSSFERSNPSEKSASRTRWKWL